MRLVSLVASVVLCQASSRPNASRILPLISAAPAHTAGPCRLCPRPCRPLLRRGAGGAPRQLTPQPRVLQQFARCAALCGVKAQRAQQEVAQPHGL